MKNNDQEQYIVLDMDGVVFDSELAKISAFKNLFAAHVDRLEEIDQYNRQNRGIPRQHKFEHVITKILQLPLEQGLIRSLNVQYSEVVMQEIQKTPLLRGMEAFLKSESCKFFLNSSAPRTEIMQILQQRGLTTSFQEIFGYPLSKTEVLLNLKKQLPADRITFFGDALADYEAANASHVRFIGVDVHHSEVFDSLNIPVIADFSDLNQINQLIKIDKLE